MKGKKEILNYLESNFKDKKWLFLENDWDLYRELSVIESFLIDRKIKYHTIFNIDQIQIKSILEIVDFSDIVIWQSTYVSEISQQLLNLINKYPDKIFIECYINEPRWYYKNSIIPDVYTLNAYEESDGWSDENWILNKLSDIPLWDKKEDEV